MNEGKQDGNGDGSGDGAATVEERRICYTQPIGAVDVIWKSGKTWTGEENNKVRKYWSSSCQPMKSRE